MGNCVGKGAAGKKDPDKEPYKEAVEKLEDAAEQAAEQAANAAGDALAKQVPATISVTAPNDDIPLADADDSAGGVDLSQIADAARAVKEGDINVKIVEPNQGAPAGVTTGKEGVTVTVESKTITKNITDVQKMAGIGEPLDAESIIENIKAKASGTDVSVASQCKTTTVTKTIDASGKETVSVDTKESSFGLPNVAGEIAEQVVSSASSKTYSFPESQVEILKQDGEHVVKAAGDAKDEMFGGALNMLKETSDGLESQATSTVTETVQQTSSSSSSTRQSIQTFVQEKVSTVIEDKVPEQYQETATKVSKQVVNTVVDKVVDKGMSLGGSFLNGHSENDAGSAEAAGEKSESALK